MSNLKIAQDIAAEFFFGDLTLDEAIFRVRRLYQNDLEFNEGEFSEGIFDIISTLTSYKH